MASVFSDPKSNRYIDAGSMEDVHGGIQTHGVEAGWWRLQRPGRTGKVLMWLKCITGVTALVVIIQICHYSDCEHYTDWSLWIDDVSHTKCIRLIYLAQSAAFKGMQASSRWFQINTIRKYVFAHKHMPLTIQFIFKGMHLSGYVRWNAPFEKYACQCPLVAK